MFKENVWHCYPVTRYHTHACSCALLLATHTWPRFLGVQTRHCKLSVLCAAETTPFEGVTPTCNCDCTGNFTAESYSWSPLKTVSKGHQQCVLQCLRHDCKAQWQVTGNDNDNVIESDNPIAHGITGKRDILLWKRTRPLYYWRLLLKQCRTSLVMISLHLQDRPSVLMHLPCSFFDVACQSALTPNGTLYSRNIVRLKAKSCCKG